MPPPSALALLYRLARSEAPEATTLSNLESAVSVSSWIFWNELATPPARLHARSGSSAASNRAHGTNITHGPAPVLSTLQHTVSPSSAGTSFSSLVHGAAGSYPSCAVTPYLPSTAAFCRKSLAATPCVDALHCVHALHPTQ